MPPCVGDDEGVFFEPECGLMFGGVGGFGLTIAPAAEAIVAWMKLVLGDIFGETTALPDTDCGYFGEGVLGGNDELNE